eukprot:3810609-Rhodomonas_salina.2
MVSGYAPEDTESILVSQIKGINECTCSFHCSTVPGSGPWGRGKSYVRTAAGIVEGLGGMSVPHSSLRLYRMPGWYHVSVPRAEQHAHRQVANTGTTLVANTGTTRVANTVTTLVAGSTSATSASGIASQGTTTTRYLSPGDRI